MLHTRPHRPTPTESHSRALRRCAESCIAMADEIILYRTEDGKNQVNLMSRDGMVWLNQSQMAELFATSKQNIAYHISNILEDKELSYNAVVKEYLTTALDGKNYKIKFYSLEMIMAVGSGYGLHEEYSSVSGPTRTSRLSISKWFCD